MSEPQYAALKQNEPQTLGPHTSFAYRDDPKRIGIVAARYKFVAKMLAGFNHVLEIGCADGFYSAIVAQSVHHLVATDFDSEFIESAKARSERRNIDFVVCDMLIDGLRVGFDAFYCIDVLEHINPADEDRFIGNAVASLKSIGIGIVGCPSIESQPYASELSRLGHVNCKTQDDLKATMLRHFANVFMFSMNDEVVHTGFGKMSHYNFALCCGPHREKLCD